jgi:PPOX class probable F420-dependent enzyme
MLDIPDTHRDLLDARFATLATLEPTGIPQMSEIWFLHAGGEIKLSLNSSRRKTKNLLERPECGLLILDVANPFRYVEIRGRARLDADDDHAVADLVHAKYGADVAQYDQPGETRYAVTIEPARVRAVDMSA